MATYADGLLIEVVEPDADRTQLKCDAEQGISPDILADIVKTTQTI